MQVGSQDRSSGHGVVAHQLAGVVHILDVAGDLDDILAAIRYEIEECQARALVIDLTGDVVISEAEAEHIADVLNDRRLDGHWQFGVEEDHADQEPAQFRRIRHHDGREILISLP